MSSSAEPGPAGAGAESRLSYSRLRAYQDCPFKFKLLYLDRKRAPLSAGSALGHSLHRALEKFYQEDGGTLQRLLDLYEGSWVHQGFADAPQELEYHAKGRRILKRFWTLEENRRTTILFVEKPFEFKLGRHIIQGIIDRVDLHPDGTHEVIDYKTQQDVLTEEEVRRNVQLQIYGLALKEAFGLAPARLSLLFVAHAAIVGVPYDEAHEPRLKDLLSETADRASSGRYDPDVSHCPRCEFRRSCPHSAAKEAP